MGEELDPREEGLDVVEEIVIVLSWIPAVFLSTCATILLEQNYARPEISGHVFFVFFSFSSSISLSTAIRYQTQLVESFHTPIFLFLYAKLDTGMKCIPGKKSSSRFMGMGTMDRGVFGDYAFFLFDERKQIKLANNKALISIN